MIIGAAHNQTVRPEDDSLMPFEDDDDPAVLDEESVYANKRGNLNPPKNLIEREPEREPD